MDICTRINEARTTGKICCGVYHGKEIIPRKARFKNFGLSDPTGWENELKPKEAEEIITNILSHHLESNRVVMEKEMAATLANAFIQSVPENAKFYSNQGVGYGPEPLSQAFMDTGIFCELNGIVGLLWVCDDEEP